MMRKLFLLAALNLLLVANNLQAQSSSEVNTLRRINPDNPNNAVWTSLSNTSKYISVGVPVGYFVAGLIHDNKDLKQKAAYTAAAILLNTATTTLLKNVVKRERPYNTYTIAVPALAWSAGVGYSRIYLGQHYPSDVIMGAIVGSSSALICHWATKQLAKRKKSKTVLVK